jgi:Peptidase family M23
MKSIAIGLPLVIIGALAAAHAENSIKPEPPRLAPASSTWPEQLEMRVPFEPTAFSSGGRTYLAYELYLTNFTAIPIDLRRIEVLDADGVASPPIAVFEGALLDARLEPIGGDQDRGQLAGGKSVVVYLWIALDHGARVPNRLSHRARIGDTAAEGAIIGTHHTELRVLGPPVQGADWIASDGPSDDKENHHRRGILIFDGRALISRRFAIDWMQTKNGATFFGDAVDKRSYHAYGKPVLAVADATVVRAKDGLPDNVPGHGEGFRPAVQITPETVGGNTITLDLGGGQYAHYLHLQPGSVRVKLGERVRRGQILAQIGDSGDAREPHLHFQVSTSSSLLGGEGVPYLIDRYRAKSVDNTWQEHTHELPLGGMLIDFGSSLGP